jgi:hypothetical protein
VANLGQRSFLFGYGLVRGAGLFRNIFVHLEQDNSPNKTKIKTAMCLAQKKIFKFPSPGTIFKLLKEVEVLTQLNLSLFELMVKVQL